MRTGSSARNQALNPSCPKEKRTRNIMKKLLILAPILLLLVTACASEQSGPEVTVFRAPT
jgi:hypothetical protein